MTLFYAVFKMKGKAKSRQGPLSLRQGVTSTHVSNIYLKITREKYLQNGVYVRTI